MNWARCYAILLAALLSAAVALGQENPHISSLPDDKPDASMCAYCHDDSLALSRSHAETCTLCHSETAHTGAIEHSRVGAAKVARSLGDASLPLAGDGHIYCGTCHLFHDPGVMGESLLEEGRAKRDSPLNRAVRDSVAARGRRDAATADGEVEFRDVGTRYLRLPGDTLCRQCHEGH